jgi:cell shape-determining protein MreC
MLQEQVEKLRKENKELKKSLKIVETNLEMRIRNA